VAMDQHAKGQLGSTTKPFSVASIFRLLPRTSGHTANPNPN
jgi:hypothetical protein